MSFNDTDEFLTGDFYLGEIGKHGVAREPTVHGGKTVRTGIMKVSPSMRQLEEILKEKTKPPVSTASAPFSPDTSYNPEKSYAPYSGASDDLFMGKSRSMSSLVALEEEDEDELAPPPPFLQNDSRRRSRDSTTSVHKGPLFAPPRFQPGNRESWVAENAHDKSPDLFLQRDSTYSVQTFQTAQSHESPTRTISTIDESGYSSEGTPILSQPATFHDVRRISIQSKVVSKTDLSKTDITEQDDTLIDEARSSVGSAPVSSGSTKNSIKPEEKENNTKNILPQLKMPSKPMPASPTLSLSPQSEKLPLSKPAIMPINRSSDIPSPTIKSSPALPQLPQTPRTSMIPADINPSSQSPHRPTKSYSSYTLSEPKTPKQLPALPKHKRSNTVGDISKMAEPKEKKKFSFKALFKLKPKSGLSEMKMSSKSQSTPNLAEFLKKPANPEPKSFRNVFKKNKSSENLSQFNQPQTPQPKVTKTLEEPKIIELEKAPSTKKAFKSNTNFNLIREVSDDEKSEKESDFDEYDADNILQNPPTKLENTRYDQEMLLIPDNEEIVSFGSPFKVKYDSVYNSPQKEASKDTNLQVEPPREFSLPPPSHLSPLHESTPQSSPGHSSPVPSSPEKDSLLGEALFPKSLNPQEVESIVSLERSMSMKSIKSNKRNSFANYRGSNENIVYGGPPLNPPTGMTRSNSILKNSGSRRGLNAELYKSIDASIEGEAKGKETEAQPAETEKLPAEVSGNYDILNNTTFDSAQEYLADNQNYALPDFSDLLEFSDFIDVDNLDFNSSPQAAKSPRVEDEEQGTHSEYGAKSNNIVLAGTQPEIPQIEISPSPAQNTTTPTQDAIPSFSSPDVSQYYNDSVIESSPILETAYRTGRKSVDGEDVYNRPISMSFRGLKGPSFGGKLAHHNMRSSDSHQSFNISFGDDSDSAVGGGFGSDSDDNRSLESGDGDAVGTDSGGEYAHNYRNNNKFEIPVGHKSDVISRRSQDLSDNRSAGSLSSYRDSTYAETLPPPTGHSKIPSVSDTASTSSSPRSLGSMISRKWKRSPNTPTPSPVAATVTTRVVKNGVRFSSRIILYDTYNGHEYDRHPDTATCNQLTPLLAQQIRDELNQLKNEMEVHTDSKCFTHFF